MGNGQGLKLDMRNRIILMGATTSWLWGDERPWGQFLGLTKREVACKKLHTILFTLDLFKKWDKDDITNMVIKSRQRLKRAHWARYHNKKV